MIFPPETEIVTRSGVLELDDADITKEELDDLSRRNFKDLLELKLISETL
jgi:hypothetical protein